MIAALYVETDGCYFGIDGVDPWDVDRDARLYKGPHPVVAHPPCARWCQLASVVQDRYGYKIGDDGGSFASALAAVREFGGVLEHPAYTIAWARYGIPNPMSGGGWTKTFCGGWVCHVEQGHYGHRARKATWLYTYGADLPSLRWGRSVATAWVSWGDFDKYPDVPRLSKAESNASPVEFRDLLIGIARSVKA